MQTNPAVEQSKIVGPRVRGISPAGKEKVMEEGILVNESLSKL